MAPLSFDSARLVGVALVVAAASVTACGSLFGIGDLPPLEQKPGGEGDGGADGATEGSVGTGGGTPKRDGSVVAAGSDPRWALWPMPGDVPTASDFTIDNHADGAVVTDAITGLIWQDQVIKQKRRIGDCTAYCDALAYGGFDDWRLPTRIEMVSIMTFTPTGLEPQPSPMSPVDDFPGGASYWTASVVNEQDPVKSGWYIDISGVRRGSGTETHYARCVRGAPPLGKHTLPTYDLDADSILDPRTGLVWERNPPTDEDFSLSAADTRCGGLTLRGKTARVPTVKELLTIVDEEDSSPLTPATFGVQNGDLWSTTKTNDYAWYVRLVDGTAQNTTASSVNRLRCVASD